MGFCSNVRVPHERRETSASPTGVDTRIINCSSFLILRFVGTDCLGSQCPYERNVFAEDRMINHSFESLLEKLGIPHYMSIGRGVKVTRYSL
jgi:hypothetical protein